MQRLLQRLKVDIGSITVIRDDTLRSMQVTVVVGDRSDSRSGSDSYRAAALGSRSGRSVERRCPH